jgi:hypothetical protein
LLIIAEIVMLWHVLAVLQVKWYFIPPFFLCYFRLCIFRSYGFVCSDDGFFATLRGIAIRCYKSLMLSIIVFVYLFSRNKVLSFSFFINLFIIIFFGDDLIHYTLILFILSFFLFPYLFLLSLVILIIGILYYVNVFSLL